MTYLSLHNRLKDCFNQIADRITIPESSIEIRNYTFISPYADVLPGSQFYQCTRHNRTFRETYPIIRGASDANDYNLNAADCSIDSNRRFRYSVFLPKDTQHSSHVILLFHGLNEKHWEKYLSWAYRLVELTKKTVILFPIAFHMNRVPTGWSHPRKMNLVSSERRGKYPAIAESSFANAAISTRIHKIPQRFFWSGRQTYSDILQLVRSIRAGEHPHISNTADIDFFAYSIGSFLSEILLMTNTDDLFTDSRLFIFCGGPTLDRMYPVSRYILDSEANIALYSFFIEHLDNECKLNERLNHYFNEGHRSGIYFRSMLSSHRHQKIREDRFREIGSRIEAIALNKDEVIPPGEVLNTLKGDFRDLPANVQVLDFPFDYSHVTPFPQQKNIEKEVDEAFQKVFMMAAEHLQ